MSIKVVIKGMMSNRIKWRKKKNIWSILTNLLRINS